MKALHITLWDELYETCETKKIRTLTFYAKPNKLIGEGIGLTLKEPNGLELYGAWTLLEGIASQSPRDQRGWLVRNGTALTAARIAALLRLDPAPFEAALQWFARKEIGWLELKEIPGTLPDVLPPVSTAPEIIRKPSAESADVLPPVSTAPEIIRKPSAESADVLPPVSTAPEIIRKISLRGKREGEEREEREVRGTPAHSPAARASSIPSVQNVRTWALSCGIDPDFAQVKLEQAMERGDFAKAGWKGDRWKSKLERFWKEDGETWSRKVKKNGAAPAPRPDGWKDGDMDFWWTDSLADVRASLRGAALTDKKTAARLAEIIATRGKI